jgi:hypothetical protein
MDINPGMSTSTRVAIAITLVMIGIGFKFWRATGGTLWQASAQRSAADVDTLCAELLAAPNHREALEWCRDRRSAGFEMSRDQMRDLAETFYAAGADKVYVTDIEQMGDSNVSASMVVVLPTDKSARKTVFQAEAQFAKQIGEDPMEDVGQKYVLLGLD